MIPGDSARAFFEHPEWVDGFAAIVAIAAGCVAAARLVERRRLLRLTGNPPPPIRAGLASDAALLVALIAIGTAALGPNIGERTVAVPNRGTDVVFLIDVSRSMAAADVPPTRIDRARRATEAMIGRLDPGDRAALAVFADRGWLLTPLTPDRNALVDLLAEIAPGMIEPASSNTGAGIGASLGAFEVVGDRPRVVVLLTDGEDSKRSGDLGAAAATRQDTRVVAFALGTEAGGHVPFAGGILHDRADRPVVTRRVTERLEGLAAATGGGLFLGDEWGRFDFDVASDALHGEPAAVGAASLEERVPAARVAPFAAVAFAILLIEGLPRGALRRRKVAWGAAIAIALWGVEGVPTAGSAGGEGTSAAPTPAEIQALERAVRDAPEDARARIDLGIAYSRVGSGADSAREFLAASLHAREAAVAATAYFDLGVVALGENDLARASDAFFEALRSNPEDAEARFNLEWTLELLREQSGEASASRREPTGAAPADADSTAPADAREPAPGSIAQAGAPESGTRLTDDERREWLERVSDDSRGWLQSTAPEARDPSTAERDPVW